MLFCSTFRVPYAWFLASNIGSSGESPATWGMVSICAGFDLSSTSKCEMRTEEAQLLEFLRRRFRTDHE